MKTNKQKQELVKILTNKFSEKDWSFILNISKEDLFKLRLDSIVKETFVEYYLYEWFYNKLSTRELLIKLLTVKGWDKF